MALPKLAQLVLWWIVSRASAEKTCEDGSCLALMECGRRSCEKQSVYGHGGSAQAYKPFAPIKTEVCGDDYSGSAHKVASWPFTRSKMWSPPRVNLKINVMSCSPSSTNAEDCCCQPWGEQSTVEVWQTRPDGSYSSLRPNVEEGDCRARQELQDAMSTTFTTFAPGSTGALSGLGPSKLELGPYGSPTIHVLVSAPGHERTLIDLPFLLHRKTLAQRSTYWPDWRGVSWMKAKPKQQAFEIVKWAPNTKTRQMDIEVNVYVTASDQTKSFQSDLCPAWLYPLPLSFFLEPIAVCAPSLLDFFAL